MDDCIFCKDFDSYVKLYEDETWIVVEDKFPVSKGHTLIIPKRHCETFFDLNYEESVTLPMILSIAKEILKGKYNPQGYNIGANCGTVAGQTIHHCHIHLIPRYEGDVENPRGGVRGCIPSRMNY